MSKHLCKPHLAGRPDRRTWMSVFLARPDLYEYLGEHGSEGDMWRCPECGKLWYHTQWFWRRASWWMRFKYRKALRGER